VIWVSILGVLPFTLLLPHVDLFWTSVLSVIIGLILSSAFSAILVYAQELLPGKVGMIAGLFFGFAFGMGGLGAALLGELADARGIEYVYHLCAYLPAIGLLTVFLPNLHRRSAKTTATCGSKSKGEPLRTRNTENTEIEICRGTSRDRAAKARTVTSHDPASLIAFSVLLGSPWFQPSRPCVKITPVARPCSRATRASPGADRCAAVRPSAGSLVGVLAQRLFDGGEPGLVHARDSCFQLLAQPRVARHRSTTGLLLARRGACAARRCRRLPRRWPGRASH
jgi:MFS family permease